LNKKQIKQDDISIEMSVGHLFDEIFQAAQAHSDAIVFSKMVSNYNANLMTRLADLHKERRDGNADI
jgi:hypothetical protein